MRGRASPHSRHTQGWSPGPPRQTSASRVVTSALSVRLKDEGEGSASEGGGKRGPRYLTIHQIRSGSTQLPGYRSHRPSADQPGGYLQRQGRKENTEPINRFRPSVPIYTATDTELSPASQTRASTSTYSRGLIDDTKDRTGKEPKVRAGLSNDGEMHSTVYRTLNRYHRPQCLSNPPPVTARP